MNRRVLLARVDSAGDVLLTGPAVRAVAASGAQVHYLCGPRGADAARVLPGVDDVIVQHVGWIDAEPEPVDPAQTRRFVARLASLRLDEAVVFTSFHQSPLPLALLLRLAGVRRIAAVSEDYAGSLLDVRHRLHRDVHEVQRNLSLVATLGYRLPARDDGRLAVVVPGLQAVRRARARAGAADYVVVHPGASVPARAWDPERAAALVERLSWEGRNVVVTGGASERALTARVAGDPSARSAEPGRGQVVDLGGRTDFAGLARVVAGARVLVVGNTGPAHLAAAVGTPVVSLFAPTVPAARWRPWGVPHELLGHQEIGCAGCRSRTCPRPGHPCLGVVEPDAVFAAIDRLTGSKRRPDRGARAPGAAPADTTPLVAGPPPHDGRGAVPAGTGGRPA